MPIFYIGRKCEKIIQLANLFSTVVLFKPERFHRESMYGRSLRTLVWAENQERAGGILFVVIFVT